MANLQTFKNATGDIPVSMTNDYLFRAFLQENQKALTGLVSALFHLSPDEIRSVEVTNPIELGASITDKTFILDVAILLNSSKIITLEMQVTNQHDWNDRSVAYLCREFDNVAKGSSYTSVFPVVQVDFLDFTLFDDHAKFYSKYQLMETDDHYTYNSKIELRVIDLTQIQKATDEDRYYKIDQWAAFFKAKTWEALKMLAKDNEYIESASETIYRIVANERIREQCEAREEALRVARGKELRIANALAETAAANARADAAEAEIAAANARADAANARADAAEARIADANARVDAAEARIAAAEAEIAAANARADAANARADAAEAEITNLKSEVEQLKSLVEKLTQA